MAELRQTLMRVQARFSMANGTQPPEVEAFHEAVASAEPLYQALTELAERQQSYVNGSADGDELDAAALAVNLRRDDFQIARERFEAAAREVRH